MKLVIGEKRSKIMTRPVPALLAVTSTLEGQRSWLKNPPGFSFETTPHNLKTVQTIPGLEIEDTRLPEDVPVDPFDGTDLSGIKYEPKTEAYDHQYQANKARRGKAVFAFFAEQGTGKTKMMIDWIGEEYTAGTITGVILVSKKGAHRQFVTEQMPTHFGGEFDSLYWPFKLPEIEKMKPGVLQIISFNYDGLKTPKGLDAAHEFAEHHRGRLFIAADESQEMKNPSTGRWRAMAEIKPYSNRRCLATGTPVAKDFTDEWGQMKWLDEKIIGVNYLTTFKRLFCIMGGFEGRDVIGHQNVEEFRKRTDPFSFRVTKEEIGILPKARDEWVFDMTKEQKRLIREIRNDLNTILESGEEITVGQAVHARNKVQQISNGFIIDENKETHRIIEPLKNPRVLAFLEWLDCVGSENKAIVWFRFREDAAILEEALGAKGESFRSYHGGTKDADRVTAVESFLDAENGCRVFLANPQSAGTGLNLQGTCNNALYYSNSFNSIDRWQSEDRIHRIGTKGICTFTDLITPGSTDRRMVHSLQKKKGIANMAVGDPRKEMLNLLQDIQEE